MKDPSERRQGYKKTNLGWIPKEWECAPAGELFDIQLGKMLSKKARIGNNLQPYLANYNVRWGSFDLSDVQQMSFNEKEIGKFQLQSGDLLVCEGGEVGRCAVWQEQINPCYYQKALHRVRSLDGNVDIYFIMYFLHYAASSPMMVNFVGHSSIPHFTREKFLKFPIVLPPLNEQHIIARIINDWDTATNQVCKLISLRKKQKKALMQKLFFSEKTSQWKKLNISKVFQRVQRTTTNDVKNVLSITANVGFVHQKDKFSKVIAGKNLKRYILLNQGEFAYNKGNSKSYPQGCIHMLEEYEQGAIPNVYYCFKTRDNKIHAPFYKYYFASGALNHQLHRIINTGVRNDGLLNLNPKDFFKLKVHLPPISDQHRIAKLFSCIDIEIEKFKRSLAALEKQKRGLMQKLLTGQVRVTP
jgi:type I restriction enzyme S subunit